MFVSRETTFNPQIIRIYKQVAAQDSLLSWKSNKIPNATKTKEREYVMFA